MKQSTANGIRSLLMHISEFCRYNNCDRCAFSTVLHSEGIDCYFDIKPKNWNIEDILERYKELKKNEQKSDAGNC